MPMNPADVNFDAWAAKLAGVAGAVVSMRFLQGTWPERVFMALSGAVLSYFATPFLSARIGLPEGLTGFLLGLFGMAITSRAWEWVQTTPVGALWQIALDWLQRRSGAPK
jgi:hypothetical protein